MSKRRRGIFITFEGPEGAGKSTHSRLLAAWLRRQGCKVMLTREPGGTALGNRLRSLLLDPNHRKMDALMELCLYEASRAALVTEVLQPALRAGRVVVVDRFQDSTWVYQGWAGGLDLQLVEKLGKLAMRGLKPNLTILLDLPVRKGLSRVRRPNRIEAKPVAFHQKVRRGYLTLARRQPRRFKRIDVSRPIKEVQAAIREAVSHVLE